MGKAVVASRLPALQEIITDGETGLLYEADSVISLSTNLEKLIEDNKLLENLDSELNNGLWQIELGM